MRKLRFKKTKPEWKKKREKIKKERLKDFLVRVTTLIVFFAILLFSFNLWQNSKKSIWDGGHQINFILQSKDIAVFSYNPEEDVLNMFFIDPKTYIPVAKGFGNYPVGNIYSLGRQENLNGGELLDLSLEELLAVPIDGHIIDENKSYTKDSFSSKPFYRLLWCKLIKQCNSNLTLWDLYRLASKINKLNPSQLKSIDIALSSYLKLDRLPDGSEILKPNFLLIDKLSIEFFSDYTVSQEGLTVSVYNGTNTSGMAAKVGRFVNNIGAELVFSGDERSEVNNSTIYIRDEELLEKYSVKRLAGSLKISRFESKDLSEDISIIIGKDFIFLQ